jgi:hypothetical protein
MTSVQGATVAGPPAGKSMTATFRVLIEGHHILMRFDDGVRRSGFVQTYWIEAETADDAAFEALKRAAEDGELRAQIENGPDSPPGFSIYEVERCTPEELAEVQANPTGRASFPETVWSRLAYRFRRLRGRAYADAATGAGRTRV